MTRVLLSPAWVTDGLTLPDDIEVVPGDDLADVSLEDMRRADFVVMPYNGSAISEEEAISRMPNIKVIQTLTAGFDGILPLVPAGVTLCNAAGVHDVSTAEMALVLTLTSMRGVPGFLHAQDRHEWVHYVSHSLATKTVALIGYGGVGTATEKRLLAFDCMVVPFATHARDHVRSIADLPTFLPQADVVVITVPLNESTHGLVDAAFLGAMKPGALLVNVARGPVVDTDALVQALHDGHVHAALDVTDPEPLPTDHPLWSAPNVVIAPHLGGDTDVFEGRARVRAHDQILRWANRAALDCVIAGSPTPY